MIINNIKNRSIKNIQEQLADRQQKRSRSGLPESPWAGRFWPCFFQGLLCLKDF
jgi:hypothetical protein